MPPLRGCVFKTARGFALALQLFQQCQHAPCLVVLRHNGFQRNVHARFPQCVQHRIELRAGKIAHEMELRIRRFPTVKRSGFPAQARQSAHRLEQLLRRDLLG